MFHRLMVKCMTEVIILFFEKGGICMQNVVKEFRDMMKDDEVVVCGCLLCHHNHLHVGYKCRPHH